MSKIEFRDRRLDCFTWVYTKYGFHWYYDLYKGWIEVENEKDKTCSLEDVLNAEEVVEEELIEIPIMSKQQYEETVQRQEMQKWEIIQNS